MSAPSPALEVRYSPRSQVPPIVLLGLFAVAMAVAGFLDVVPAWLAIVGAITMASLVVVGVYGAVTSRKAATMLTLDQRGLTVHEGELVPWSDLQEVLVTPMKPAWLVGSARTMVVAFIPRPGVELPGPPHPRGRSSARSATIRRRTYGTNLTVLPSAMSSTAAEIAAAADRLGGIPSRWVPHRALRKWLIVVVVGVFGGVVTGAVLILVRQLS